MSSILVIAEHLEGKLKGATLNAVTFANKAADLVGHDVVGVVLASGGAGVATELAKHVSKVVAIDDAAFENYLAEAYSPAIAKIAEDLDAELICAGSTTTSKDYLPRVCAALEGGFVSDAIDVYNDEDEDQLAFKRPIWAGNLIERVTSDADVTCVTVRTTAFDASTGGVSGSVENRSGVEPDEGAEFLRFHLVKSDRPELTEADVIVSGGRGLKSADAFGMIEALADKLGGAVGASRAAVDSGYAPNDWQIGQTGKIVAPDLYIAAAISGAIQHLAGMKGSKVIVAINKDSEAPIFQVADYGLVADAFKAVPELTEKL